MFDSLVILTLAAVAAWVVSCAYRWWGFGLCAVLGLSAAHAFADFLPSLSEAPFSIYPDDVVFAVLAAAAFIRLLTAKRLILPHIFWIAFGCITLLSLVRGIRPYGFEPAGNDVRSFFYVASGVTYFCSFPFTTRRFEIVCAGWQWLGIFLVTVALFRWAAYVAGIPLGRPEEELEGWLRLRVLNANRSLVILQAAIVGYFAYSYRFRGLFHAKVFSAAGRLRRSDALIAAILTLPFIAVVLVLQHRSVWVVAGVTILLVLYLERQRARIVSVILIAACLFIGAWTIFDMGRSTLGESLKQSSQSAITPDERNTFLWRVDQWTMYYREGYLSDPVEWLLGKPFGAPYGSLYGRIDVSPHNWYVYVMIRVGLLGLAGVLVGLGSPFRTLWNLGRQQGPRSGEARTLFLLFASQAVFSTVYTPAWEQCVYLGLGLSLHRLNRRKALAPSVLEEGPGRMSERAAAPPCAACARARADTGRTVPC